MRRSIQYTEGRWDPLEASSAWLNRGLLFGDGFFTTVRCYHDTIEYWDAHWNRICQSASVFRMVLPWSSSQLFERVEHVSQLYGRIETPLAIRITITRGEQAEHQRGLSCPQNATLTATIIAQPYTRNPDPISVGISSIRRLSQCPLSSIKHLGYQGHLLAKMEAEDRGLHDMILLNERHQVCCTTVGNIFLHHTRTGWITPPLQDGCIDGIFRRQWLQTGVVCEQSISREMLEQMDAGYTTNCLRGATPIGMLNGRSLAIKMMTVATL
jgi:branched-subunit amino acid aminotransferase/4-amino-4-deoxychorismate lyase